MTQEQRKDLEDLGFLVSEEDERGKIAVSSETIPNLETLQLLILTMTFQEEIHYWDAYRESPTDPGGYVTALRLDADKVAFREGNQSWMSRWEIISVEELSKHMQKNWDKDHDRGKFLNKVLIEKNQYITREKICGDLK